jgi:hypothetical protein
MLTKIERLGDRLLSLVVPHARASADCFCYWIGVCDRTRDWWCCTCSTCTGGCLYRCSYNNPCP